jgi:hypothetical protein
MTTASRLATHLVDHLLVQWPGGSLLTAPIATVLTRTISRVHELTTSIAGKPVPFDRWLTLLIGEMHSPLTGDRLARHAADRLIPILQSMTASAAQPAVPQLPAGTTQALAPIPSLPGFTPPRGWNQAEVIRALASLGAIGLAELATIGPRLGVATALAQAAVALPGVRSTWATGSRVHSILQDRYRAAYSPPSLVVADRQVTGGLANYNRTPLADAAVSGPPPLVALYLAWLNSRWVSSRRSDLTDLTIHANWEIKPLLGAPQGVLQEAWYRCAYNWTAHNLEASEPSLVGKFGWMLPGAPWSPSLLGSIPVGSIGGVPAVAVPYCTAALPGLVLYAVVSGPTAIDIAILVALLLRMFEDHIKKQINQVTAAVVAVLNFLASVIDAIAKWIAENLIMLVVVIVCLGLAAALVAACVPGAPACAALGAAGIIFFILNSFGSRSSSSGQLPPDTPTTITLDFAGASIRLPTADAGKFCTAIEAVATSAFRRMEADLQSGQPAIA